MLLNYRDLRVMNEAYSGENHIRFVIYDLFITSN